MTTAAAEWAAQAEKFALTISRHFPGWLARSGFSIAVTANQAGKVFFIGLRGEGRLSVFERSFPRSMGLGVGANDAVFGAGAVRRGGGLRRAPSGRDRLHDRRDPAGDLDRRRARRRRREISPARLRFYRDCGKSRAVW